MTDSEYVLSVFPNAECKQVGDYYFIMKNNTILLYSTTMQWSNNILAVGKSQVESWRNGYLLAVQEITRRLED